MNSELRKDCPMRHENGNCIPAGGFCTAVNDPICEALHNAYECGEDAQREWAILLLAEQTTKFAQKQLAILQEMKERLDTPVADGRWVHLDGDEWGCSNCGEVISTEGSWEKPTYKHCHECGAKMNLEVDGDG